jgi:hypothetical protein
MRRLARLTATPEFLVMCCQGDRFRVAENTLPGDATVVFADVAAVDGLDRIVLTLESEMFDDVSPGEVPPELPAPIFRRW